MATEDKSKAKEMSMRKFVMVAVILVSVTLVMALQGGVDGSGDQAAIEKAVLEANTRMTQAEKSLDADRLLAFILDSDKGPIIQDGRLFKTRTEALETIRAGFQGIAKIDRQYDQTYVTVLSPETALLTGTGSSTATLADGRALSRPFAVSLVFVLRDGRWKVLQGHYSTPNP